GRVDAGNDILEMGARHLVYSGSAGDEYRLQHQLAQFRIGTAGWLSHLSGDGHRHGDQLVHPAALSAVAWNDYRVDLSGDFALGDVAGDRIDGCGRADFVSAQMEFDRQDFSWIEDEQSGEQRVPDEVGRNRIDFY